MWLRPWVLRLLKRSNSFLAGCFSTLVAQQACVAIHGLPRRWPHQRHWNNINRHTRQSQAARSVELIDIVFQFIAQCSVIQSSFFRFKTKRAVSYRRVDETSCFVFTLFSSFLGNTSSYVRVCNVHNTSVQVCIRTQHYVRNGRDMWTSPQEEENSHWMNTPNLFLPAGSHTYHGTLLNSTTRNLSYGAT